MNNAESKNLGSMLRRIIAMALVLSLVLIPVQFPGQSSAVEDSMKLEDTRFSDDFLETENTNWQWNESFANSNVTAAIKDGVYRFNLAANQTGLNFVKLSGVKDGVDATKSWSNYTVSADMRIDHTTSQNGAYCFRLMGYVNEDGYGYAYHVDGVGNAALYYYGPLVDETGTQVAAPAWVRLMDRGYGTKGNWVHTSMKFENLTSGEGDAAVDYVKITITHYGVKASTGDWADVVSYNWSSTRAPEAGKYVLPITGGTVGFSANSSYSSESAFDASVQYEADNVKVVTNEGDFLFGDEFDDAGRRVDVTSGWNTVSYSAADYRFVESKHETNDSVEPEAFFGGRIVDGKYYVSSSGSRGAMRTFLQQKGADGQYALPAWDDYTFELDVTKFDPTSDLQSSMVFGRVSYDAATGKYSAYTFRLHGYRFYGGKMTNGSAAEGDNTTDNGSGMLYINGVACKSGTTKIKVTFTTVENVLHIQVTMVGTNDTTYAYEYTDNNPLPAGSVGFGQATNNGDGPNLYAFDNLKVTVGDAVLVDEDFEKVTGPVISQETVGLRWNKVEGTYQIDSRWIYKTTNSKVLNVTFNNPAAGETNQFRMDLEMKLQDSNGNYTRDVSKYFADGMLSMRTWIGDSETPEGAASFGNAFDTYTPAPPDATNPLSTGMLLRVNPVYEGKEFVGYTYYRIRVCQNYLYLDKNVYDAETGELTLVNLASRKMAANIVENYWHVLAVQFKGNTFTVYHNYQRPGGYQAIKQHSYTLTDTTENPYLTGGVSLWAQAEHSETAGESPDWNVNFDYVYLAAGDARMIIVEKFENEDYMGDGYASSTLPYVIKNNTWQFAENKDSYYFIADPEMNSDLEANWNVESGMLTKTTAVKNFALITMMNGEEDEAVNAWKNYGVEAIFQLAENATAGILFRHNGFSGYELRFNGEKVILLRHDGSAAVELASAELILDAEQLHTVDIQLQGDVVTYKVDNGAAATFTINDKNLLTNGTAGLIGDAGVKFDNVRVYSLGAAPTFSHRNNYTSCQGFNLFVKDVDGDLETVIINGEEYTGEINKKIWISKIGENVITAIDANGNSSTISVNVRAACGDFRDVVGTNTAMSGYTHYSACLYCNTMESGTSSHKLTTNDTASTCSTCSGADYAIATVSGTSYGTIQKAIAIAKTSSSTVTLNHDLITRGLEIPAGVTLDLNGHHLDALSFVSLGQVIDSVGTGGLRVTDDLGSEPVLAANKWLPLADEAGYYRFFEYTFTNLGVKADGEFQKFGMRLTFEDAAAYDLLLANDIEIGFKITWTGLDETLYYVFKDETVKKYVDYVKAKLAASEDVTTAMILKVRELEKINLGYPGEMTVTPILMTDATDIMLTSTSVDANPL